MLYSVLSISLIVFSVEFALLLSGIKTEAETRDPYVGFVPSIPLFNKTYDASQKAVYQTSQNKLHLFNLQSFPVKKSPQTRRVFCLGGSTSYGRPFDDRTSFCGWLREYLIALAPDIDWQLINAGGISYASYRIATLMQELSNYAPDLFIVYSGHNEFLERRTYAKLIERPEWIIQLEAGLSKTRTYTSIKQATHWLMPAKNSTSAESLQPEVSALLDSSVGLSAYNRDKNMAAQTMEHYRYNLQKMIDISRRANVQLLFVTPAANLRSSSPFKSEFQSSTSTQQQQTISSLLKKAAYFRTDGDRLSAINLLQQARDIDPRYAETLYQLASVLFEDGQFEKASRLFRAARDEDICPLRILSPMLEDLSLIAQHNQVELIDFAALIESASKDNYGHTIPGHEYFYDHVHPTIQANSLLARALIERIKDMGLINADTALDDAIINNVQKKIEAQIDSSTRAKALRNLAKVLSWAGKTEDAARLARLSIDVLQQPDNIDNAESLFILGLDATNRQDWAAAENYFRGSVILDPNYPRAHNNLALSLVRQNRSEEAIVHYQQAISLDPKHTNAHFNLANAYRRLNLTDAAIEQYQAALNQKPDDVDTRLNLASLLAQSDRESEALVLYESLLLSRPNDADTHLLMAELLEQEGNLDAALMHYQRASRLQADRTSAQTEIDRLSSAMQRNKLNPAPGRSEAQ